MNEGFYRQTATVEGRHWWFDHRRRLAGALFDRYALGARERGLDLGCGTGGSTAVVADRCTLAIGVDRSPLALELARERGGPARLIRADANRLGDTFAAESFDLVSVFNVLYHSWIGDPAQVLAGVRRVLRPGGTVVLTEPAWSVLRRRHDVVDFGARRFRPSGLNRLLRQAGLEIRFASSFNAVATIPALARATLDRCTGRIDARIEADENVGEIRPPGRAIDAVLRLACRIERAALTRGIPVPLGVGVVVVACRPAR
jgi:SAM-dependent methyltransferase